MTSVPLSFFPMSLPLLTHICHCPLSYVLIFFFHFFLFFTLLLSLYLFLSPLCLPSCSPSGLPDDSRGKQPPSGRRDWERYFYHPIILFCLLQERDIILKHRDIHTCQKNHRCHFSHAYKLAYMSYKLSSWSKIKIHLKDLNQSETSSTNLFKNTEREGKKIEYIDKNCCER